MNEITLIGLHYSWVSHIVKMLKKQKARLDPLGFVSADRFGSTVKFYPPTKPKWRWCLRPN